MSIETGVEAALQVPTGVIAPTIKVTMTFVDPEGEVSSSTIYVVANNAGTHTVADLTAALLTLVQQYAAMSAGQLTSWRWAIWCPTTSLKPPEPAAGTAYDNIEDKLFLNYNSTLNTLTKMNVPMPLTANFLADGETADPGSAALNLFSTSYLTGVQIGAGPDKVLGSTETGVLMSDYIKGYFRRAKTRRRLRQGISTEIGG